MMPTESTDCAAAARAILAANDRGGYTVPTAGLYPFQWNWDSAFVAMGFATFDLDRGLRELERLAEGQWRDGMIPHIVFHAPSDTYFPGPEVWGTEGRARAGAPATSGITQPPVFGLALGDIAARAEAAGRLAALAPRLGLLLDAGLAWHRWWLAARDPDGLGLVAILHPWESGSDNSPAWDQALALVPTTTTTAVRRKDTGHVDAAMRPSDTDYRRYIHLVDTYRAAGWDPARQWRAAPFRVADVQSTAILAAASRALADVARRLERGAEESELARMADRLEAGLDRQWRPALRRWLCRDLVAGADIETPTQAGLVPVLATRLAARGRDRDLAALVAEIERWSDGLAVMVPSTPPFSPAFEPRRYWRGPVWAVVNLLIAAGLESNGAGALAARIRRSTRGAIERAGFAESFDPVTGGGCGGQRFSWTAAAYLLCAR